MRKQYRTVIFDKDLSRRDRLRQALREISDITRVTQYSAFPDFEQQADKSEGEDIVFISDSLDENTIRHFVATHKDLQHTRDAAFVLCVPASQFDKQGAVNRLLGAGGLDGFLVEPFSVDSLRGIIEISERVKNERQEAREKVALNLLAREIGEQVDGIWQLMKGGGQANYSRRMLKETCTILGDLSSESLARYYQSVIDVFENRQVVALPVQGSPLRSASSRVRERAEQQQAEDRLKRAQVASEVLRKTG